MPLIPKNTKSKVVLFFLLIFIISGLIYFKSQESRIPVVIDINNAREEFEIPEGVMEDGVIEGVFDNGTTTKEIVEGEYSAYSENKVSRANDGAKVVLFFNASWCPTCQSVDRELTSSEIPEGLLILSVDYDSYITLKKEYEVTYQHTFVQVDGDGNMIKKWSGGDLKNIIKMTNS